MKDKNTDNKLGTQPVHEPDTKTSTLKFTDYSISKSTPNFIDPITGKTKERVFTPFGIKQGALKGTGIMHYFKNKAKIFVKRIHLKTSGKTFYWSVGNAAKLTTKDFEDQIKDYFKTHTNDRGHWIKDPRSTIKDKTRVIEKKVVEDQQKLTINEVIERLISKNFPRSKSGGCLDHKSQKSFARYLVGYNKRYQHMKFVNDKNGNGKIELIPNFHLRTAKPDSLEALFKKYPSKIGMDKKAKEVSLYDTNLGKTLMCELQEQDVVDYINGRSRSYGEKVNIKKAVAALWNFAKKERLLGSSTLLNPTLFSIDKPDEESSFEGSKYNHERFSDQVMTQIFNVLLVTKNLFPFQAECLMLLMCTGIREETAKQLRWSMVDYEKGIINVPRTIIKGRKKGLIIQITQPVQFVLDLLKEQLEGEHKKYKFVDWMFPTTRIDSKRLTDNYYINSHSTRIATLKGAWQHVKGELGIFGSPKMFRKTFVRVAKLKLETNAKVKTLTGHTQDKTIDVFYDKHNVEEQKEYADTVAQVFSFMKKSS